MQLFSWGQCCSSCGKTISNNSDEDGYTKLDIVKIDQAWVLLSLRSRQYTIITGRLHRLAMLYNHAKRYTK